MQRIWMQCAEGRIIARRRPGNSADHPRIVILSGALCREGSMQLADSGYTACKLPSRKHDRNVDVELDLCNNRQVDWALLLPIGFTLLAPSGLILAVLAAVHYFRSRGTDDEPRVPVAMVAFAFQYILVFIATSLGGYILLPTILLFFTLMALLVAIRVGLQSHSGAGSRIALAALCTLGAYVCIMSYAYRELAKFHR